MRTRSIAFSSVFAVRAVAILVVATLVGGGCGRAGFYPVSGKVVDEQGQAIAGLEGSQIVFQPVEGLHSCVGEIAADGSYSMFTDKPGDGVPPGKYQVYIPRRYLDPEHPAPQAISTKYEKMETSGLEANVEPKKNTFEFKVSKATGKAT